MTISPTSAGFLPHFLHALLARKTVAGKKGVKEMR
jgi:hypothetical protein